VSHPSRDIANLPPEALLRLPEVIALVGLCRASIYARAAKRSFPPPIKLTAHASGWRLGDVRKWLADPTGWKPQHDPVAASRKEDA
jgi:prophage regulatory protein